MGATTNQLSVDQLLKEGTALAQSAFADLNRLAKITDQWPEICARAAEKLKPYVRTELDASWSRTGLNAYSDRSSWKGGDYSGALYEAWVTRSIIKANDLGILVYIAPGMANAVYKRAGEFQHGGVHGVSGKGKKAASLRGRIKRAAKGQSKNLGGGVRTVAARPIYFDTAQIDRLASKYIGLVSAEINKLNQVQ